MQQDYLIPFLTVKEYMLSAAELKISTDVSRTVKDDMVIAWKDYVKSNIIHYQLILSVIL